MNLQQLSDRVEIQELLARYCHAIDENNWTTFAELFIDDAECDYTQFGGPRCDKRGLIEFLSGFVSSIAGSQHTISTMAIDLAADTAKVRTAAQVMLIMPDENGVNQINVSGLWYHDTVVKTAQGWRIKQRTLKYAWASGLSLKTY